MDNTFVAGVLAQHPTAVWDAEVVSCAGKGCSWIVEYHDATNATWGGFFDHQAEEITKAWNQRSLPWGEAPYDSKTPLEVVRDYGLVRGDLSESYAQQQLAIWIERYVDHKVEEALRD